MQIAFDKLPIMSYRRYALIVSAVLILGCLGSLGTLGLNYGIDFTGGSLVQLEFDQKPQIQDIRESLATRGLEKSQIQEFGSPRDILVRAPQIDGSSANDVALQIQSALERDFGDNARVVRVESVGPKIGQELREQGVMAVLVSMMAIIFYLWWRFELKFGLAAILALVHDVIATTGILSLTQQEFSLSTLAAVLTVIGYSLNDTIVVFDRIRENLYLEEGQSRPSIRDVIDRSISETLSRTILTSITTLIVVLMLYLFGGEIISSFAFALLIGVCVGTYSSVFVGSLLLLYWQPRFIEPHLEKLNQKPEEVV